MIAKWGPPAAFVSAGSLSAFVVIGMAGDQIALAFPALTIPRLVLVLFVALWVWVLALGVVTRSMAAELAPWRWHLWFVVGRWAMLVAVALPFVIAYATVTNSDPPGTIAIVFFATSLGVVLLIHNIAATGQGVFGTVVPMIGIVAALSFLSVAGLIMLTTGDIRGLSDSVALIVAMVFYVGWAIWIGLRLLRARDLELDEAMIGPQGAEMAIGRTQR